MTIAAATPADRHRLIAADFSAQVAGTTDWDAPAPVPGWTARDVVGHLVEWLPGLLSSASEVRLPTGPSVQDNPVAAWRVHADGVQAVLDGPQAQMRFAHEYAGEHSVAEAIDRFYTADVFMHTWDLARASGQEARLDPEFAAQLLDGMSQMEEVLRSSGQYGAPSPVSPDADVVTRLVAFIGRDLEWAG